MQKYGIFLFLAIMALGITIAILAKAVAKEQQEAGNRRKNL